MGADWGGGIFSKLYTYLTTTGSFRESMGQTKGWAKIYGDNRITIDAQDDPYAYGFQVI